MMNYFNAAFMVFLTVQITYSAHTLNLVQDEQALCLDGSRGSFYFDRGSGSGAKSWIIYFQGGGWIGGKSLEATLDFKNILQININNDLKFTIIKTKFQLKSRVQKMMPYQDLKLKWDHQKIRPNKQIQVESSQEILRQILCYIIGILFILTIVMEQDIKDMLKILQLLMESIFILEVIQLQDLSQINS